MTQYIYLIIAVLVISVALYYVLQGKKTPSTGSGEVDFISATDPRISYRPDIRPPSIWDQELIPGGIAAAQVEATQGGGVAGVSPSIQADEDFVWRRSSMPWAVSPPASEPQVQSL